MLNNGRGLDLEALPRKLQVVEVEEALEAWAVLTQDRIQREIYEAREKARRDAEDWQIALRRAQERLEESLTQGRLEGIWIGRIRTYEELLGCEPKSDAELSAMSTDELRDLAEKLRVQLSRP